MLVSAYCMVTNVAMVTKRFEVGNLNREPVVSVTLVMHFEFMLASAAFTL